MALTDTTTGHRMGKAYSVGAKRRNKRERRGRPAHDVAIREPNGRASRSTGRGRAEEPVQALVLRQRARIVGTEHAGSQLAESAIGILCLLGRLSSDGTTAQEREAANYAAYDAGVWWRTTLHRLNRLIGAPPPYARSPAWEMVGKGSINGPVEDDLSEIADPEARAWAERELIARKQALLRDYERGRCAMGDDALAVEALVIHDRAEEIAKACRGLAALVVVREK
jgi:hypothetical protein